MKNTKNRSPVAAVLMWFPMAQRKARCARCSSSFFYIEIVLRIIDLRILGERHGVLSAAAKSHIHHANIRFPHDIVGNAVCTEFIGGTVIPFVAKRGVDQAFLFHEQKADQSHPDQTPF